MNQKYSLILATFFLVSASASLYSKENAGGKPESQGGKKTEEELLAAGCDPGTAQTDLAVNNVRTTILVSGDMWWDLQNPKYEIPKGSGKHSMFAGALWIGGIDAGGQLKVAAMTYRQDGNDFWPGPLDNSAAITAPTCLQYDKHFKITRKEVEDFAAGTILPTQNILNWPGNGPDGMPLAPFWDLNGNMVYEPQLGEYPQYILDGQSGDCANEIFGDQTLWWVFNDRGNIHTETGAESIGLEIKAQAFGFSTNDEINNMTFYHYVITNKSSYQLNSTYFGQWVDPDLGYFNDDYVGCDVPRGLGYCYNGDAIDDDGQGGYGANPPAIGVDFFQGPRADPFDGVNNDRDSVPDEEGEKIIMSKFVYYNNDWSARGNPENATHFYGYLKGIWKDGLPMTYGGTGYNGTVECDFMFPGDSDHDWEWGTGGQFGNPAGAQQDWFETALPEDRRFLQSAGPFTLKPGAVNYITTGVVWARASSGGPMASVELLKTADDKAQALFDNCFRLVNGPDAPDITLQELDKELILYLSNKTNSNNSGEDYEEVDPTIITPGNVTPPYDNTYNFEGYQIFQLKDATVSVNDIHNPDKARLVIQCDMKNFEANGDPIAQLINFYFDPALNANVPVEEVRGANEGILHSFSIKEDAFATGDKRLVNHKQYHFMAIAYAYNNFKEYEQNNPLGLDGQKKPYLAGRKNIKVYTGIPHIPSPESNGTVQSSSYGTGPKLKRIEGQGNGGQVLDLTQETVNQILSGYPHRSFTPEYEMGKGPVKIKVVDPLNVPDANFTFKLSGTAGNSTWTLRNESSGVTKSSDRTIQVGNEQIIPEWGMSVWIQQVNGIGATETNNGFIEASMTWADPTKQWLTGIADADGETPQNWIRSGTYASTSIQYNDYAYSLNSSGQLIGTGLDDDEIYEKILGGTWAPYRMTANNEFGPGYNSSNAQVSSNLNKVASVDIVITPDKSKWTRCVVLEMCSDPILAEGSALKNRLRKAPSVDKEGNPDGSGTMGMGWFPGYAINIETGERLNMAFGENSFMVGHNGRDMKWNPGTTIYESPSNIVFGGMHYIYVFGHNQNISSVPLYDSAAYIHSKLYDGGSYNPGNTSLVSVYKDAMWTGLPLLVEGRSMLETEVKIRLRVSKPYKVNWAVDGSASPINSNNPMYTFSTSELKSMVGDVVTAKDALELINVVPNPYYAYSSYEKNNIDTRIKITNLPVKCKIKIFTLAGTLVKEITRDDNTKTSVDWDLKNHAGIPVASGIYIIHVEAEGIGEKVLKWFGIMRPQDLDTF